MRRVILLRVNGVVMRHVCVRQQIIDGRLTTQLESAVRDEHVGWFAITETDAVESEDDGWRVTTKAEVMAMLQSTGLIRAE
jgi:hypothetical protein